MAQATKARCINAQEKKNNKVATLITIYHPLCWAIGAPPPTLGDGILSEGLTFSFIISVYRRIFLGSVHLYLPFWEASPQLQIGFDRQHSSLKREEITHYLSARSCKQH